MSGCFFLKHGVHIHVYITDELQFSSGTCSGIIMRPHRAHMSNSLLETFVSEMQL